jgi:hypothetical protein
MNEIERPIEIIEAEINFYKGQTATGIIEIGKRLIEAKAQLQHGEWGKWLEEKVEFKNDTARKFMQVAREFSNTDTYRNLNQSKIFALLDVPQDQREEFIATTPIDDMTTRQLQQAIKDKKELEQMLEDERRKPALVVEKEVIPESYLTAKTDLYNIKRQLKAKDEEIDSLKKEVALVERKANINDLEAKKFNDMKKQMDFLMKEKTDISRQIESATALSGLAAKIDHLLKGELAPIRYSRVFERMDSEVARENLLEIIEMVDNWSWEIKQMIPERYRRVTVVK